MGVGSKVSSWIRREAALQTQSNWSTPLLGQCCVVEEKEEEEEEVMAVSRPELRVGQDLRTLLTAASVNCKYFLATAKFLCLRAASAVLR